MSQRLITFYLTQFHPTKENDAWWGKGFTEWTNVTKAVPLFNGHYQPHLPTDFGFYDLRLRETRRDQIRVAKEYGIDGFCYHYYWFSGTRLLNVPLDDMLADTESDMPFCLCWANENWTKRWDAADHEVLIAQQYLPDDDLNFIKSLVPFFSDSRYIRLNGVPFLIVYRPQHLPDAKKSAQIWREYCRNTGIGEIHICAALTHGNMEYARFGFDSGVEFPPHNMQSKLNNISHCINFFEPFKGCIMQFEAVARSFLNRTYANQNVFRGVFPSWDNTARTANRALIILNGTPENYEYWLAESIRKTKEDFPEQDRFVFINAWNEWAEGCHLEPDRKHQRKFLEATLRAKRKESQYSSFTHTELPAQFVGKSRTVIGDLRAVVNYHISILLGRLRVWVRHRPRIAAVVGRIFAFFR
jgi:lipopolysaccharide biosynthesis protein